MSNKFTEFIKEQKMKKKAGYNDATITPELVSSEERISSPSTNLQYVTDDEAKLLKDLTGIDNVISQDDSGSSYITPVHLEPHLEAIINKNRTNRDIPNNGPFYANDDKGFKAFASEMESSLQEVIAENNMLKSVLKKTLAKNKQLVVDRKGLLDQVSVIQKERMDQIRTAQVRDLTTLMQKKGMLDDNPQSFAQKVAELSSLNPESYRAVKEVVLQAPNARKTNNLNKQASVHSILNEQPIQIPHRRDTPNVQSTLNNLPWGKSKM